MGMSYGFVEIAGVTAAVDALDLMCKSADVKFVTWERRWGGRLVKRNEKKDRGCSRENGGSRRGGRAGGERGNETAGGKARSKKRNKGNRKEGGKENVPGSVGYD